MKIYESNVQIAVAFFSTFLLYSNGPNPNYAALGGLFMHMSLNFFYVEQRWQFFNSVMKKSKIRFHLFQLIVRDLWTSPRISESTFSLCHNDLIHFNQCLHAKSGSSSIVSNHDFWRENSNSFCQIWIIIYSFKS